MPFQKGNKLSKGRPKARHTIQAEKAREFLIKKVLADFDPIITKQLELAKNGDRAAIEYLLNQTVGKPKETMEIQQDVVLKIDV